MGMVVEGLTGETPPECTGPAPDQQERPALDEGPDRPVVKPDRFTRRSHEVICTPLGASGSGRRRATEKGVRPRRDGEFIAGGSARDSGPTSIHMNDGLDHSDRPPEPKDPKRSIIPIDSHSNLPATAMKLVAGSARHHGRRARSHERPFSRFRPDLQVGHRLPVLLSNRDDRAANDRA
jgi:hypothetical protein